ncbi:MAG: polyphosphate kinase 1, partial [Spirochaetota bacterium]|nr:polyphosphate kinase 1 [Spirochaetota bacterium]
RISQLGRRSIQIVGEDPRIVLEDIQRIVIQQRESFEKVFADLKQELGRHNIHFVQEWQLNQQQRDFVYSYFVNEVRPKIFPVMIDTRYRFPEMKDTALYLLVEMNKEGSAGKKKHSIIEIPSKTCSRFIHLPSDGNAQYIILLEDVIRLGLPAIFSMLDYDTFRAYDIKITRDSELDIDDDFQMSYLNKVRKSLDQRKWGNPVRLAYDTNMPHEMLEFLKRKLKLKKVDTLLPGGRYHNSRDYIQFPGIIAESRGIPTDNLPHKDLDGKSSIIDVVRKKDVLLHFPYHSFDYLIDMLREASLDPKVSCIKITLYRLARYSSVINALINARKNRKEVIVLLELQARFDEKANINWANKLQKYGVKVIFGIPGLKVHSKLLCINRTRRGDKQDHICAIGTGNMNEDTARVYTDSYLLTSDHRITDDVERLFEYFESSFKFTEFKHMIVSPFNTRSTINAKIDREMKNTRKGRDAYIHIKLNNIADRDVIRKLYEASEAGVNIRLIVRGMFSLVPGVNRLSSNIEAISIVDQFLEHNRFYIFCNGGNEEVFLSSADLMPRNIDRRVEVTCPVFDPQLKKEIRELFDIEWSDTVKARILDQDLNNEYRPDPRNTRLRSQLAKRTYLAEKHKVEKETGRDENIQVS